MNRFISIILFLFSLSTLCNAFDLDINKWTNFEGTIGKTSIQLSLFRLENDQILGNYCYKKYENKIQLSGQINSDKLVLIEFINGKPNGRFEGKIFSDNAGRIEGTWTDLSNTKTIEFKLTLQSISGNNFEHRYADLYGTDEEVENFMKQVKTSILNGDKKWIANHISYPIKTNIYKNKAITITTKNQLIENFDLIFHQAYKDTIQSLCVCNMFSNYEGVMLGNGQIWIYNKPNSSKENSNFRIIAINNY